MFFTGTHLIYEHSHECARKGERVTDRPDCVNGVAFVNKPICIETGTELELVHRDVYPTPEENSNE